MLDLIPFEHRNNNLFNYFDRMPRNFFGEAERSSPRAAPISSTRAIHTC